MQWFNTLGFSMPYGVNMADFILDVASGAPAAVSPYAPVLLMPRRFWWFLASDISLLMSSSATGFCIEVTTLQRAS